MSIAASWPRSVPNRGSVPGPEPGILPEAISFITLQNLVVYREGIYQPMVAINRVIRTGLLCAPLALAACASGPVSPPVTAPPVAATAAPETAGAYKVGKPYQIEGIWYYPAEDYSYAQEGIASWYGADFHGKRTANGDRYDMNELTAAHPTLPMPSAVKVTNLDNGRMLKVTVNDRGPFHSSRIIDLSRRAAQLLGFQEAGTARVRVEIDAEESINLKNIALAKHPPEMPQIAAAPRANISAFALDPLAGAEAQVPPEALKPAAAAPSPAKPAAAANKSAPKKAAAPPPAKKPKVPAKVAAVVPGGGIFVQAGAFSDAANAHKLEQQLSELGKVRIVPTTVNKKKLFRVRLGPLADTASADAMLVKIKSFGYRDAKVVRE